MQTNLADDFFCMALDEHSGLPRLAPRVTGVGLASAILAELVVGGYATVRAGEIEPLRVQPPADQLARDVHELLHNRPQHRDVAIWIGFLARDAFTEIGNRMTRNGMVTPVRKRRLTGTRMVYEPVDRSVAAWPAIRLAQHLADPAQITLDDLTCAGLAVATGLIDHVLWDAQLHGEARAGLPAALKRLPPPVSELLSRTESLVADAVLTNRV